MHGFLFVSLFVLIVAILANLVVASRCPPIKVRKDTIIRTTESVRNGANLLYRQNVESSRDCYELCCNTKDCTIGVMQYKRVRMFNGDVEARKTCFIFACGKPNLCSFVNHSGYAVIEMKRATLPVTTEPHRTIPHEEKCPPGSPVAMCSDDPCEKAICHGHKDATCVPNFCGGCGFGFYDSSGKKLLCQAKHNELKDKQGNTDRATGDVTGSGEEKENDRKGDGHIVKEESIEVRPEETSGKPKEELFPSGKETEEDPHKVKEYRQWLDSKDDTLSTASPETKTKTDNGEPEEAEEPDRPLLKKKPDGKIILKKESPISWALLIALSICIAILLIVIVKLKCLGPKKKKKFAVDDGDYLINGMYL